MKQTYFDFLAALGVTALLLVSPVAAPAQVALNQPPCLSLPCDVKGALNHAAFRIRVPANWNGVLLVYLLGQKSPANNPTEPPLVPPVLSGSTPASLEEALLSRGYALAGTLVATEDMQVKEEAEDGFTLVTYFQAAVAKPERVILWGTSLGGFAALRVIEDHPRAFDAALAMCAPAAGLARRYDLALDFMLAYAAAFGWPPEWGTLQDLRTGLDFFVDVRPKVQWPAADGSNRGGWEFIRLVTGMDAGAFWNPDPIWGSPALNSTVWFGTAMRESLEAWAAGPFTQNVGRRYTLTSAQATYLAGLGVDANSLLAKMNAQTNIEASPRAREYMERYGSVRGTLRRPVLTMHTTIDAIVDVSHASFYRSLVEGSRCTEQLVQTYTGATGHCAFTSQQLLLALEALEYWLNTGQKPDDSFFPAADGFKPGFVPPPFPF